MLNFALIGAAGYIAPRHMKAISETGNKLVTALDPFDSVGILDSFFPECSFFTEFERFECNMESLKGTSGQVDFVTVCSPNYLHDSHIRFGLRNGTNVICEKPVVLDPAGLEKLEQLAEKTGKNVYTILQLRLHPAVIALKKMVDESPAGKTFDLDLTYISSRGSWYYASWKGDASKSGGIATNIGVHFYDMLAWIFGEAIENIVHVASSDTVSGVLGFRKARVRYFLSINYENIPAEIKAAGKTTYRSFSDNGEVIEFSEGFTDLHTESYRHILSGNGFPISEARRAIDIVDHIRHTDPVGLVGDFHPFARI
jgi:UDP-N-acetyl-2-amino-2-deoxyglucuronate dehydrogenase